MIAMLSAISSCSAISAMEPSRSVESNFVLIEAIPRAVPCYIPVQYRASPSLATRPILPDGRDTRDDMHKRYAWLQTCTYDLEIAKIVNDASISLLVE